MDDMLRTLSRGIKTLSYGMALSKILDNFKVDTKCGTPMSHILFYPIDEHTINKLGFVLKNN